jgi:hypothetical protein
MCHQRQLFSANPGLPDPLCGALKLKNRNSLPITRGSEGEMPSVNCLTSGEKGDLFRHDWKRFLPAIQGSRRNSSAASSLLNNNKG